MERVYHHIGRRRIHFESTDSTNTRATDLASNPENTGTVVTASIQAQGRGQHGRRWQSVPGSSVLLSALLFPPPPLRRPSLLTPFAAVAVVETLAQFTQEKPQIKWPNDVLMGGKKICGILIEGGVTTDENALARPYFIVGIGLNVNQSSEHFIQQGLPYATSLSVVCGQPIDVVLVTETLIEKLDREYDSLMNGEFDLLEQRWKSGLGLLGANVTVEQMDGTLLHGTLRELSFDHLLLETPFGINETFKPEEVRHVR